MQPDAPRRTPPSAVRLSPAVQALLDSLPPPLPGHSRRRKAKQLIARAHGLIAGIAPGQPICGRRDSARRERSRDLMFQAARLWREADAMDAARGRA